MRLLDDREDRSLGYVSLFLTREEAKELADKLGRALDESWEGPDDHFHVSDDEQMRDGPEITREITVALYAPDRLVGYGERVARLIREDR